MELTGAEIVVRCLQDEGVKHVFGYPGGAVLPIYDEIFQQEKVKHILVRHEQGAGHAAEGYARASGRVGVCVATSGPGATNLVTPIADAWMDSTPLVAITGQVPSHVLGKDAFQETDITGITSDIGSERTRAPEASPSVGGGGSRFSIPDAAVDAALAGGLALLNTNDFERGLGKVYRSVSTYYTVGVTLAKLDSTAYEDVRVAVNRPRASTVWTASSRSIT